MNKLIEKFLIREKKRIGIEIGDDYISTVINLSPFEVKKKYISMNVQCDNLLIQNNMINDKYELDSIFDTPDYIELKNIKNKVNVVLPDTLFLFNIMEFNELPKKKADLYALVEWRLRREFKIDNNLVFSIKHEELGLIKNKHSILVTAIEKKNLDAINKLLIKYKGSICSIKPYSINLHNYIEMKYSQFRHGVGIIAIYRSYWSLELVDQNFRINFIRIQKYKHSEEDARNISTEIERIVRSYIYASKNHQINEIILVGHCLLSAQIKDNLNRRLTKDVVVDKLPFIDIHEDYHPITQAALIAANQ